VATFSNARMPCLLAQHCTQFNSNSLRLSQLSISASNDLRPVTGRVETADRNRAASSTICVNVPVPYIDLVSFSTTALAVQLQGMELACDQIPVKQFSKTNAAELFRQAPWLWYGASCMSPLSRVGTTTTVVVVVPAGGICTSFGVRVPCCTSTLRWTAVTRTGTMVHLIRF